MSFTIDATIYTNTDLLPLFHATREHGEVVTIEVWAGVEDVVRAELLEDCQGQLDEDTFLFVSLNDEGDDVSWKIRIENVFGVDPKTDPKIGSR